MATNVTEKDKTLNEIIDWALSWNVMLAYDAKIKERAGDASQAARYGGMAEAYGNVMEHCRSLLGYSGSMPSEVPNQGEKGNQHDYERN